MVSTIKQFLHFTALLLIYSASARAGDHLDRLFTTKSQRESLNALRASQGAAKITVPPIKGYVRRSDGAVTWWLDNQPIPQHSDVTAQYAQKQ
jgi:hypothetical protein